MNWEEFDLESNKEIVGSLIQEDQRTSEWWRSADSNINLDDYNDDPELVYYEKNLFVALRQWKYHSSKSLKESNKQEFDS